MLCITTGNTYRSRQLVRSDRTLIWSLCAMLGQRWASSHHNRGVPTLSAACMTLWYDTVTYETRAHNIHRLYTYLFTLHACSKRYKKRVQHARLRCCAHIEHLLYAITARAFEIIVLNAGPTGSPHDCILCVQILCSRQNGLTPQVIFLVFRSL